MSNFSDALSGGCCFEWDGKTVDIDATDAMMFRAANEIERLESVARLFDLHADALAEIKASVDGDSIQPVRDIVYGLLAEIDAITKERS